MNKNIPYIFFFFIVIAIICTIRSAIKINKEASLSDKEKYQVAILQTCTLRWMLEQYKKKHHVYPSRSKGFQSLVEDGYFEFDQTFKDPWGNPYHYHPPLKNAPQNPFVYTKKDHRRIFCDDETYKSWKSSVKNKKQSYINP